MAIAADVVRLLNHPRRREIACAVLDEARSIGEIADRLDTKDGAIRTTVDYLARKEVLRRFDRPGRRKGVSVTAFQVTEAHARAVREVCQEEGGLSLRENDELLLIPISGLAEAASFFASSRPRVIAWAIRTRDAQLSLMVGLRQDAAPHERDALVVALRARGVECGRLHLAEAFGPAELFGYSRGLTAAEQPGLPSGE